MSIDKDNDDDKDKKINKKSLYDKIMNISDDEDIDFVTGDVYTSCILHFQKDSGAPGSFNTIIVTADIDYPTGQYCGFIYGQSQQSDSNGNMDDEFNPLNPVLYGFPSFISFANGSGPYGSEYGYTHITINPGIIDYESYATGTASRTFSGELRYPIDPCSSTFLQNNWVPLYIVLNNTNETGVLSTSEDSTPKCCIPSQESDGTSTIVGTATISDPDNYDPFRNYPSGNITLGGNYPERFYISNVATGVNGDVTVTVGIHAEYVVTPYCTQTQSVLIHATDALGISTNTGALGYNPQDLGYYQYDLCVVDKLRNDAPAGTEVGHVTLTRALGGYCDYSDAFPANIENRNSAQDYNNNFYTDPTIAYSGVRVPIFWNAPSNTLGNLSAGTNVAGDIKFSHGGFNLPGFNNFTCCGLREYVILGIEMEDPPEPLLTGVGPRIPFSGGFGNAGNSYAERLSSSKFAIFPRKTGNLNGGSNTKDYWASEDQYFYIYTTGQSELSGVVNPATTLNIGNAVGVDYDYGHILVNYSGDSNSNRFYNYSLTGASFTEETFLSSGLSQIIDLEYYGMTLILGSGEAYLYNVESQTEAAITYNLPSAMTGQVVQLTGSPSVRYLFPVGTYEPAHCSYPLIVSGIGTTIAGSSSPSINTGVHTSGSETIKGFVYSNNNKADIVSAGNKIVVGSVDSGTGVLYIIDKSNPSNVVRHEPPGGIDRRRLQHISLETSTTSCGDDDKIFFASHVTGEASYLYNIATSGGSDVDTHGSIIKQIIPPYTIGTAGTGGRSFLLAGDSGEQSGILLDNNTLQTEILTFKSGVDTPSGLHQYSDTIALGDTFYAIPKYTQNCFPSGNIIGFTSNTVGPTGIEINGDGVLKIDVFGESGIFEQTTTELTGVLNYNIVGDHFKHGNTVALSGDPIFMASGTCSHGSSSGLIYIKPGVVLDFETKNTYTGSISGYDPFLGSPYVSTDFVVNILNVDDPPTGIFLSGNFPIFNSVSTVEITGNNTITGTVNQNHNFGGSDLKILDFTILDADTTSINTNLVELSGTNASDFYVANLLESGIIQTGELYLKQSVSLTGFPQAQKEVIILSKKSGTSINTATGIFLLDVLDVNEAPDISIVTGTVCVRDIESTNQLTATISGTDPDNVTDIFRQHQYSLQGAQASRFQLQNINTGTQPSTADLYLLAGNTTTSTVDVVIRDMNANGLSVTGSFSITPQDPITLASPTTSCFLSTIPLNTASGALLGYATFSSGNIGATSPCTGWSSFTLSQNDTNEAIAFDTGSTNPFSHIKATWRPPSIFGAGSILDGNLSVNHDTFNVVGTDKCCGITGEVPTTYLTIGPAYVPYLTGVGPTLPFSGGAGNVELSYAESLSSDKFAIFPRASGGASEDQYFYMYTVGEVGLTGVVHPSVTLDIKQGVAFTGDGGHALLSYSGDSDNTRFYDYSLTGNNFTAQTFLSNGLSQIINLNDRMALIIGTGSASIYDVATAQNASVTYNLPSNITGQVSVVSGAGTDYLIFPLGSYVPAEFNYPAVLSGVHATDISSTSASLNTGVNLANSYAISGHVHSYDNRADIVETDTQVIIGSVQNSNNGVLYFYDKSTGAITSHDPTGLVDRRRLQVVRSGCAVLYASHDVTGQHFIWDTVISSGHFIDSSGVVERVALSTTEHRSFLLGEHGTSGTILNNIDYTSSDLTFDSLGEYSDIISKSGIFYAIPKHPYGDFPSGNIIGFSTTTVASTGIELLGSFAVNETVVSGSANQATTGLIEIGTYSILDDEFSGGSIVGFPANLGEDQNVFTVIGTTTGTIFLKSGVFLDYETKNSYTGFITGVDPFLGGTPFIESFVLNINDVDEQPTSISMVSSSGLISQSINTSTGLFLEIFNITDPDSTGNTNLVDLAGADAASFFIGGINQETQVGGLYLATGIALDSSIQDTYTVNLLVRQSGTVDYTDITTFTLTILDSPPTGITFTPTSISILETYNFGDTNLKVADFVLLDPDTTINNVVALQGSDAGFFSITYDATANSGSLSLLSTTILDYETKTAYTATVVAQQDGAATYTATDTFIVNITDVVEAVGIQAIPSNIFIDEGTYSDKQFITTLTFTDTSEHPGTLSVTNLQYVTGEALSATDNYEIVDNITTSPDLYISSGVTLDYESQSSYQILVSGYHASDTTQLYGALVTIQIRDVDEPPVITFNPTSAILSENIDTSFGDVYLSQILCSDEDPANVVLSFEGVDSSNFVITPVTVSSSSKINVHVANLSLKSGTSLSFSTKNSYSAGVVGFDGTSRGPTGVYNLNIDESDICNVDVSGIITNCTCSDLTDGSVTLTNLNFTGTNAASCLSNNTIYVEWPGVDLGNISSDRTQLINMGAGTYTANIFVTGTIPNMSPQFVKSAAYTVTAPDPLTITQIVSDKNECLSSGNVSITVTGGTKPYSISYAGNNTIVSGASNTANFPITFDTSGIITITDSNNCETTGTNSIEFVFETANQFYEYINQTPPLIHDNLLSSFSFKIRHGVGPYEINIYEDPNNVGEKGNLISTIDKYDTTVLDATELDNLYVDESGNPFISLATTDTVVYSYDIGSKIYPGNYVFEFINEAGCKFEVPFQNASNTQPLSATIQTVNNSPFEIGFNTELENNLNTLFIPYNMIKRDNDLLSYLSNITHDTDIKLEINGTIYQRKALHPVASCDSDSIFNITFLGLKSTEWFYTMPIYQGFDIDDTDLDILNSNIKLVFSGKKINIVTKFNNNTRTIKLLKGALLTSSENIAQYATNKQLELNQFDLESSSFINLAEATIGSFKTLHNKYVAGRIFYINILNNSNVSQHISTSDVSAIDFDCNSQQRFILQHKEFIEKLNNFENTLLYVRRKNYVLNNGSISMSILGGYPKDNSPEYDISYKFYDKTNRKLSDVNKNNSPVTDLFIGSIIDGVYIIKIKDIYGNKIKVVNLLSYDILYTSMIDYIINELNTTKEALNFEYGDLLIVIYNTNDFATDPPDSIPGEEVEIPVIPSLPVSTGVSTSTIQVSPNTTLNNSITIQTEPIFTKYIITGPYGFNKEYDERTILTQLPPGVYDIEGKADVLRNNYLYQDKRCLLITEFSKEFVSLKFESYSDRIVIDSPESSTNNSQDVQGGTNTGGGGY